MVIAFDPLAPIGALRLVRLAAAGGGGGGGASAGDVRAGGAFVELFTKDNRLVAGLAAAQKRIAAFGASMLGAGAKLSAVSAGLFAPFAALFKVGVGRANELKDLQDAFGLTAESASKLAFAADVAGVGIQDLNTLLFKLAQGGGSGPLDEQFLAVVQSLLAIEDPTERAQAAFDKFGKAAKQLLPALGDIEGLLGDAPIIDQASLDNAEKFEQETKKIWSSLTSALLPALKVLTPLLQGVGKIIRENASVLLAVGGAVAGLVAAGAALTALGFAASAVGAGLGVLAGVIKAVGLAIGFILSPVGLFVAAAVGLGVAFVTLTDSGQMLAAWVRGGLADAFAFLSETFSTTWGGIKDALMSGDLRLAGEIAVAGLTVVWRGFVLELTKLWNGFKAFFVDAFHGAVTLVKVAFVDLVAFTKEKFAESFKPVLEFIAKFGGLIPTLGAGVQAAARAALATGDADPEKTKTAILNAARDEQEARDKARKADTDAARADLARAQAELQRLRDQAAAGREASPAAERAAQRIEAVAGALARGSFGAGSLGAGFFAAGGGIPKQQLDEQKRTTAAANATAEKIDKLAEKLGFAL